MSEYAVNQKRKTEDRRKKPTSPFSRASLYGRRKAIRREEDKAHHKYVDRYSVRSVATILVILVLSISDAIFTLRLIAMGAEEVNPVMDFFLKLGPAVFLGVKYFLTVGSLLCFLILKNHYFLMGRVSVKAVLGLVLALYLALIGYELWLLADA